MLVSQAIEQYKGTLSPETSASHLNLLTAFAKRFEERELEELEADDIPHFAATRTPRRPFAPRPYRMIYDHTRFLKEFLAWCAKEGFVSETLPNNVELPEIDDVEVVEVLTHEQIRRLLAACKKEATFTQETRDTAILYILLETGMSADELCNLKVDDIFSSADKMVIRVQGRGGHNEREIPLGERASVALRHYIVAYRRKAPREEQHVFISLEQRALTVDELTHILLYLRDKSQVEGVQCTIDTLRQTFAMNYLKETRDYFSLAVRMGLPDVERVGNFLQAYPEWTRGKNVYS
ncbi:MAG TPA: tyrosine-type recombinase/integrase [Ktedonobacterales bacterium]|jgi:site-specific recombinase XerD